MPKIPNWSKASLGTTWRHDDKPVIVTIKEPVAPRLRRGNVKDAGTYDVVKRGQGTATIRSNLKSKEKAKKVAREYMRNNPDPPL